MQRIDHEYPLTNSPQLSSVRLLMTVQKGNNMASGGSKKKSGKPGMFEKVRTSKSSLCYCRVNIYSDEPFFVFFSP